MSGLRAIPPHPEDLLVRVLERLARVETPPPYSPEAPSPTIEEVLGREWCSTVEIEATGVVVFQTPWYAAGEHAAHDGQLRLAADVIRGRVTVQLW